MAADAHYTKAGGYLEKNEIRFKKPVYLNGFSKSRLVSSRIKPQLTWYMTRHVSRSTDIYARTPPAWHIPGTLPPICKARRSLSFLQKRTSRSLSFSHASNGSTEPASCTQPQRQSSSRRKRDAISDSPPLSDSQYCKLRTVNDVTKEKGLRVPSSEFKVSRFICATPRVSSDRRSLASVNCPQPLKSFVLIFDSHSTIGAVSSPLRSPQPERFSSVSPGTLTSMEARAPPENDTRAPSAIDGRPFKEMTGIRNRRLRRGNSTLFASSDSRIMALAA